MQLESTFTPLYKLLPFPTCLTDAGGTITLPLTGIKFLLLL